MRCFAAGRPPDSEAKIRWALVLLCLLVSPTTKEMRGALLSLNKACLSPRRMRRPALLPSTGHGGWRRMSSVCLQPCPRARGAAWRLRGVDLRLSLLLVGRGGRGQRAVGRGPVMGVNWRGSFEASAFGRGADRLPPLLDGLLPWRKPSELLLEVPPLSNKRRHLLGGGTALVLFFSAGRGGEGEGGASGAATMLRKWLIPDGAGGSDVLNCRLPELCFHPLVFAAPGLECLRYYHMRCVSLWIHPILISAMVEYQFCSHKAKQISGQQRSWSCLCACKSIRRGKDHQRRA